MKYYTIRRNNEVVFEARLNTRLLAARYRIVVWWIWAMWGLRSLGLTIEGPLHNDLPSRSGMCQWRWPHSFSDGISEPS